MFRHKCCQLFLWSLLFCTVLVCTSTNGSDQVPKAARRIINEPESVWVEFIQLAHEQRPLNLGQGFPDFPAPQYLIDSLHNATDNRDQSLVLVNQYARSFGHLRLVDALVKFYRQFGSLEELLDPKGEVLITVGAYEALFVSIMAFVDEGDEVIIIDPAFDAYAPMVEMARGKSVFIPLRLVSSGLLNSSANFALDMQEFEAKISNRTKLLVLNTPNNPMGKMYSRQELESIAELCIKHNILVLADEVYAQMYHKPNTHISIASLAGMWNRTITVGSAGKTFSVTGWKVGWALGPKHLIKYVQLVHQTAVYTVATPLQEAVARTFEHEMSLLEANQTCYWDELRAELLEKRNRMVSILERNQIRAITPQGGYFMLVDFEALLERFPQYKDLGKVEGKPNTNDYRFARWLSSHKKLQGIPASAFYSADNKVLAERLLRLCFIKQNSTLSKFETLVNNLVA